MRTRGTFHIACPATRACTGSIAARQGGGREPAEQTGAAVLRIDGAGRAGGTGVSVRHCAGPHDRGGQPAPPGPPLVATQGPAARTFFLAVLRASVGDATVHGVPTGYLRARGTARPATADPQPPQAPEAPTPTSGHAPHNGSCHGGHEQAPIQSPGGA